MVGPDGLTSQNWGLLLDRRPAPVPEGLSSTTLTWLRVTSELGDDPVLQACALAYCSDDMPTGAAMLDHPGVRSGMENEEDWQRFMAATLDHAIWFHRPLRADRWHLHALQGQGLTGGRGLALGRVFDGDGLHVATVAQEVVVRERRDAGTAP
jgi:acyl-CoA thioesterase-2